MLIQYIPKQEAPHYLELCNTDKYNKFIMKIDKSNISDREKEFLKLAASRFIVFDYAKIADYYINCNNKIQTLMKESSLVVIDVNDNINKSYDELTKNINKILTEVI